MKSTCTIFVAAALSLQAASASAMVVDATQSHIDAVIVGNSSGQPAGAEFLVVTRDIGGTPLGGVSVVLHFAGSGVRLCEQQNPGIVVDCTQQTATGVTSYDGQVIFRLRLGGYVNIKAVEIRANSVRLGYVPARSTDINADGRTGIEDLRLFRTNLLTRPDAQETDYNLDGRTTLKDLNVLRGQIIASLNGTLCP